MGAKVKHAVTSAEKYYIVSLILVKSLSPARIRSRIGTDPVLSIPAKHGRDLSKLHEKIWIHHEEGKNVDSLIRKTHALYVRQKTSISKIQKANRAMRVVQIANFYSVKSTVVPITRLSPRSLALLKSINAQTEFMAYPCSAKASSRSCPV